MLRTSSLALLLLTRLTISPDAGAVPPGLSDTGFRGGFSESSDHRIGRLPGIGFGVSDTTPVSKPSRAPLALGAFHEIHQVPGVRTS